MQRQPSESGGSRIKATETTIAIVETLQAWDGAGVTDVADEIGKSKSTVHGHLKTLERNRFVVRSGDEYHLGMRFLDFGGYARDRRRAYEAAKTEVDDLVDETGGTVQFVVEEHGRGIYLYQARGEQSVKTDSYTGNEVYLHCTAVGKAILAHLPEERVHEIVDRHGLPPRTSETVTSRSELFERLDRVRDRGHAFDDGERIEGIRCTGVPVTADDGKLVGALSVSGPANRLEGRRFRETIPGLLEETARVIEIRVTYS